MKKRLFALLFAYAVGVGMTGVASYAKTVRIADIAGEVLKSREVRQKSLTKEAKQEKQEVDWGVMKGILTAEEIMRLNGLVEDYEIPKPEPVVYTDYEDGAGYEVLAEDDFIITGYCKCEICCGKWSKFAGTASGALPKAGVTVAADPSVLPFGTKVVLDGHIYTVQDTGSAVKAKHLDVFCNTHEEAKQYGKTIRRVMVLARGDSWDERIRGYFMFDGGDEIDETLPHVATTVTYPDEADEAVQGVDEPEAKGKETSSGVSEPEAKDKADSEPEGETKKELIGVGTLSSSLEQRSIVDVVRGELK